MFDVPKAPTAAPPAYDMTRAGVQSPLAPQGQMLPDAGTQGPPQFKKGILAAIVCAGTGLAIGVFVTRAWMKAHGKKKA